MIFLYSSFRVSSTWLYSCFRCLHEILAYNEIFNEDLAKISRAEAADRGPNSWYSKHPSSAPYFLEFIPLIKESGGVSGYTESMAFDLFIPADGIEGSLSESEQRYITDLINHAEASGKIPLLSCTRSLGRANAIKSAFAGTHILIYRNMFQQWCSYCEQAFRSNYYFLESVAKTIKSNQQDAFFQFLHREYNPAQLDSVESFERFVLFHLYVYGRAYECCDLTVDVNKLSSDADYRANIESTIAVHCGAHVDLSDVKNSIAFSFTDLGTPIEFKKRMEALKNVAEREIVSHKAREFIGQCTDDAIEEYNKYYFYANPLMQLTAKLNLEQEALRKMITHKDLELQARDVALMEAQEAASEYRSRLDHMNTFWWWRFGNKIARAVALS